MMKFFTLRFSCIFFVSSLLFSLTTSGSIPNPDKVVIVVLENHAYSQIVGSPAAPYINSLLVDSKTALFTQSYALSHPSQPNYIQLFSGSNQGITNNTLPLNTPFTAPNLGAALLNASKTFSGYSENLPFAGYLGETASGGYARKHSPWVHWQGASVNGIPDTLNKPFTDFPTNYSQLPNVSFVIPNLNNAMHDGVDPTRITTADTWLQTNLDGYIQWCKTNNSLFILTFDEDDNFSGQHILTFFTGQMVLGGSYPNPFNHYNVLRTLEDMFDLPYAGASATATPIDFCWDACSHTASVSPPGPIYFCSGDSIKLIASQGATFLWSTGQTTQSIIVSASGNYSVTTDDGLGCVSTSSDVSITESNFPSAVNVFTETMGSVSGTTQIAIHEANNGFDNDNFTMSGTADVRATQPSQNYPGASAGANIFITNQVNKNFLISNINTTGLTNLELTFGIFKNTTASTGSDLLVQVSDDGVNFSTLSFTPLPTGQGSGIWHQRTISGGIPSTSNLRIQFIQTGSLTQYRIDDVSLKFSSDHTYITANGPTSFCQGGVVELTASSANSYFWSTGETTQSINVTSSGNYYVIGSLSTGCLESSNNIVVDAGTAVNPTVTIFSNLGNSICAGDNVTFTAFPTYGGTAPTFQWQVNGFNTGITTTSYSNNSFLDGDVVTCFMTSNASCAITSTATSNPITMQLNLNVTPEIYISNNAADTICSGESVTFSASPVFSGSNPSYHWKVNGIDAGTDSINFTTNTLADGDQITCILSSSAACASPQSVTSSTITMVVSSSLTPSLTIASNTGNTICAGTTITFTASPVNEGPTPYYQWTKNGFNTGTNSNTFSTSTLVNGDVISCVMISSASCPTVPFVNSNDVVINVSPVVTPSVTIASSPGTTICSGTNVIFTAAPVNGGSTPSFQWRINNQPVGTDNITFSSSTLSNGDVITCVLTNNDACTSTPNATSNSFTMTVNPVVTPSVSITANPGNSVCNGTNVMFTATPVNGGATPIYQWKKNGTSVGINSNTYSDNALVQGDIISCDMTNNSLCATPSTATSNNITMTVNSVVTPSVTIAANPGTTICNGTLVTFTATPVNGGATPVYQWKRNGTVVGSNVTYSNNFSVNGDVITCTLTNNSACATTHSVVSNSLTMTVAGNVTPTISIQSNSGNTICSSTNVTFTATITNGGAAPTYQWKKNGTNVGVSANFYTNNSLVTNDVISCVLTSNATCPTVNPVTSNSITMTVTSTPVINSFNPTSGGVGVGVTINGSNFIGVSAVMFNGLNALFSVISNTQILAYVPNGASTGVIQVVNACGTGTSSSTFTFNATNLVLNLKLFIEGYYIGSGTMNAAVSPAICDTITVELRSNLSPYSILYTSRNTINTTGNGVINFPFSVDGNNYYIVVYNHNSIHTWSASPVLFSGTTNYDFTTAASKAFGNNQKNLNDGNFALFSGDVTQDGAIDNADFDELQNQTQLFQTGYLVDDLTGDNIIESGDFSLIENNRNVVVVMHP